MENYSNKILIYFRKLFVLCCLIIVQSAAIAQQPIKTGIWYGAIKRADNIVIPFNFEVFQNNKKTTLYIYNGSEKILVDDIQQKKDSLYITLPFYGASIIVYQETNEHWVGYFIKKQPDKTTIIPFFADYGLKERFVHLNPPQLNIEGIWAVQFINNNKISQAIANFTQSKEGHLEGSFLTPTGDYRFLQGVINKDTIQLSGFDGGFITYFTAIIKNDSTIVNGSFYSGEKSISNWDANKNPNAQLPDEYNYSHLREGETKLDFSFNSTENKKVSINDPIYKNKVVIIQILGSWCPNCMDESKFLVDFYKKNKHRGVEVIGLAYEKTTNFKEAKQYLSYFQKRLKINYPILITGATPSDQKSIEKSLPQIDRIAAFPTTIFINKKGHVVKIKTGYEGPGTGKFYEDFKKEFNAIVDNLLHENGH